MFSAANCKNRWNQLRDQWRKQKKKNITKSGQAAKPSKPWRYDLEMSFLEPFVRLRDTIGNLTNETAVDEDENLDENIANDEDSTRISDSDEVLTSATNSGSQEQLRATNKEAVRANTPNSSSGKIQRTRFLKNKDQDTASSALMKYLLNKQETERSVLAASAPKDATDAFFAGIIAKVKRFSPYYKNMVESKIFNFVQEIELQQIMQGQQQQQDQHIASQLSTHQHQEILASYSYPVTSNSTTPFSGTPSPHTPQSAATYLETFSYDESSQN